MVSVNKNNNSGAGELTDKSTCDTSLLFGQQML